MRSAVSKLNALILGVALLVAVISVAVSYHLEYDRHIDHAKAMLAHGIQAHVSGSVGQLLARPGHPPDPAAFRDVLYRSLEIPELSTFGIWLDADGRPVTGLGLDEATREQLLSTDIDVTNAITETADYVYAPAWRGGDGSRVVVGFAKASVVEQLRPVLMYTIIIVALGLLLLATVVLLGIRQFITEPLTQFVEKRFRKNVDSLLSGVLPERDGEPLNVLPRESSRNIERSMVLLNTWARHKVTFDQFVTMSVSETNKARIGENLFRAIGSEFPVKSLLILEKNHSLNRLESVYCSENDVDADDDFLANPDNCYVYRTATGLIQASEQTFCATCRPKADEAIVCKPLIAGGTEIGVCKAVIDRTRLQRELGATANVLSILQAFIQTYVDMASLSLSNLMLLDSYKNQAITDGLTGLYNRRYLVEYMSSLLNLARRNEMSVSVLIVDIDNFKRLNDEYGHALGDKVLRQVARTMRHTIRDSDTIARYGGEEFVVVMPESDPETTREGAERLRAAVAGVEWDQHGLGNIPRVTISVGVSAFPLHGYSHYHLINAADKALYVAKREGKDRVAFHRALPAENETPEPEFSRV